MRVDAVPHTKPKRTALCVRVSTDHQSVENQVRELKQVAERRGWTVEEVYRDAGISGAKGRDKRPGLDAMLKDASRTIEHLEKVGVDLYLDQQNIDTTTPTGRLLFQITGAFGEFERSMIRQRVRAGLNVIKDKLARDGKFVSKAGRVRRKLGRPGAEPDKIERARLELAKGIGIGKVAREVGPGVATVHRLKREIGEYTHN
jgi:DNA invertase Pin-like site-specific DNA recombinase